MPERMRSTAAMHPDRQGEFLCEIAVRVIPHLRAPAPSARVQGIRSGDRVDTTPIGTIE